MKKVLLIDDSPTITTLVKTLLKPVGIESAAVSNGQEALDILAKEKFDLILTDYNMPIMGGLKFIENFRAMDQDTPVVFLTTEFEDHVKQAVSKCGINGWILKPFKPTQLISYVQEILK